MQDLLDANLHHARLVGPPRHPLLERLLRRALDGEARLLRLSPVRTVLLLPATAEDPALVLKACHPRRRTEAIRRLLAPPPAVREARRLTRLAARLDGLPGPVAAEQSAPGVGWLCRRWLPGTPAAQLLVESAAAAGAVGEALGRLHALGWCDPDLHPDDLVCREGRDGTAVLPVDLGHARIMPGPVSPLAAAADLVLVLAALPAAAAAEAAPPLVAGHARSGAGTPEPAALLSEAGRWRLRARRRRLRRCLRGNRDYRLLPGGGVARRDLDTSLLAANGPSLACSRRRRAQVADLGRAVAKEYRRAWPARLMRALPALDPARRAWLRLNLLELLDQPAARALAWQPLAGGGRVLTRKVEGRTAGVRDLEALAAWLARLHAAGLGLRDAKPANFRMASGSEPLLVDADGVTRRPRPARDLGRILAELDPGDTRQDAVLSAYADAGGRLRRPADARRHARRLRRRRTANQ